VISHSSYLITYLGATGAISPEGSRSGVTIGAAASEERVGGVGGSGGFGMGLRVVVFRL